MCDNEFNLPFERAFKRLRVDGDLQNDSSDNEEYLKESIDINWLTKHLNDVPSCTSSSHSTKMWRSTERQHDNKPNNKTLEKSSHYPFSSTEKRSSEQKINAQSRCSFKTNSLLNDLKKTKFKSTSNTELAQNCSNQARNETDINVNELAAYLDCQLYLPKKMSYAAELLYS